MDDLVRRRLAALKDTREIIADPTALYSGAKINDSTLVPGDNATTRRDPFRNLAHPARSPNSEGSVTAKYRPIQTTH